MMEEDEETLFDQERLLSHKEEVAYERRQWKNKLIKTATLSMSFFCLGLCIAIPGPTLLDLGKRVNHDTEHMTFIFTARSIGYLVGALVGGVLFDFFNQQILLFYTMSAAALATASVPWCASLLVLSAFICVQGVAMGVLDSGGNVYCIKIWGQKSAPFMQILHFAFGVGAFLAPLIARPFLMDMTLATDNMTGTGYYPVNFKVISLKGYNRAVRNVDVVPFQLMGRSYGLELDTLSHRFLQAQANPWLSDEDKRAHKESSSITSGTSFEQQKFISGGSDLDSKLPEAFGNLLKVSTDFLHSFAGNKGPDQNLVNVSFKNQYDVSNVRVKRQQADDGGGLEAVNNFTQFDNGTQSTLTLPISAVVIATVPPPTAPRAKKPDFSAAAVLRTDTADASDTDAKVKDLMKNQQVQVEPAPREGTTVATTPVGMETNMTSPANTTESVNNTSLPEGINNTFTLAAATDSTTTDATITTTTEATTTEATTTEATTTKSTPTVASTTVLTTTAAPSTTTFTTPSSLIPTSATVKTAQSNHDLVSNSSTDTRSEGNLNSSAAESASNISATEDDLFSNIITTFTGMSTIQLAYALIGMLLVINAGLYLVLYCKDRLLPQSPVTRSHDDLTRPPDTKCFVSALVILLFFFFFSYVGMEVTFGGLLTTFAVYYPLNFWDSAQAATLTALFWGSIALGRCLSIFIARCFKPPCMMVTNLCFTIFGALLLSFTVQLSSVMLWAGTVILGLGMSSLFPTTISWANSYYPLTGRATAVFVAGSGIGEMVIPVLTGYLFDKINPMAVMYMALVLSTLMCFLYLALQVLVLRKGRSKSRRSHSGFMRLNNSEDMADAVDMDTVDMAEGGAITTAEALRRRRLQDENGKCVQNGDSYSTTELTKLVELSD